MALQVGRSGGPRPPERAAARPLRVGLVMDGSGKGYGVFELTRSLAECIDRTRVTPVGIFLGPGYERSVVGKACAETCELPCGCFLPLSMPGHSKWYLPNLLRKGVIMVRAVRDLTRTIKRLRIDVVHVHFYPLHLVAGLACRLAGVPCLWHWHGPFQQAGVSAAVVRFGFNHLATAIPCISRFVLETLPRKARAKACVVYNGVDVAKIVEGQRRGELRAQIGVPAGVPLVGLFGAIMERKGQEYFVRAAAQVVRRFPSARFVIVGGEDEICRLRYGFEARYRRLAKELGVEKAVIFAGPAPQASLLMGDCDIICMPTVPVGRDSGEGFGLVMAEAMAAGVPVVATTCGAPPEVIENGVSGLLVPPRDSDALAGAIQRLLEDEGRRKAFGQAAQRRIREHFDIRRTAEAMEKLYGAVARGGAVRCLNSEAREG